MKTIWIITAIVLDIAMFVWFMHSWANLIVEDIVLGILLGWVIAPVTILIEHPVIVLCWVAFMEVTSRMWKP